MNNKHVIFHIDMDSFFVSCERTIRNDLQNFPCGIARKSKRAIVTALSSEAKKLGAKVGDPIYKVKEKVPNIILIEPNLELYQLMSIRIFDFIRNTFSPNIEIYSIDECYVDVTDQVSNYSSSFEMATKIQNEIKKNMNIPCSIGISYNKFLAKMSTNLAKPHGIVETKPEDVQKHFYHLDIEDFFGIGRSTAPCLRKLDINTIEDFVNYQDNEKLRSCLGVNFWNLKQQILGKTVNKLEKAHTSIKSVGNSVTFMEYDLDNSQNILKEIATQVQRVSQRLINRNLSGHIVKLQLRTTDRKWSSYQTDQKKYINSYSDIYNCVSNIFFNVWKETTIRGVGVHVSGLINNLDSQWNINLFEPQNKKTEPKDVINNINCMFNGKVISSAEDYLKSSRQLKEYQNRFSVDDYDSKNIKKIKITKNGD